MPLGCLSGGRGIAEGRRFLRRYRHFYEIRRQKFGPRGVFRRTIPALKDLGAREKSIKTGVLWRFCAFRLASAPGMNQKLVRRGDGRHAVMGIQLDHELAACDLRSRVHARGGLGMNGRPFAPGMGRRSMNNGCGITFRDDRSLELPDKCPCFICDEIYGSRTCKTCIGHRSRPGSGAWSKRSTQFRGHKKILSMHSSSNEFFPSVEQLVCYGDPLSHRVPGSTQRFNLYAEPLTRMSHHGHFFFGNG